MATAKLGVDGLPKVGDATLEVLGPPWYTDPGRAKRDGERPLGGKGEDERGGAPEPVNFF